MTIMPWNGQNPEQPWGSPQGLLGPRRRGGLFGASANIPQMPQTGTEQPQKPGFDWRKLLGVLGDSLSIAGGGQAQYVPSLIENRQRQQAQAYAEQQYQRRRQDENTDWMARQEWERANPKPINNDTINDFNWYKSLSPADREIFHQMNPQYRQGADGRFYRIDIAPQGPPPQITEDDWAKGTPVGGGTSGTPAGGRF